MVPRGVECRFGSFPRRREPESSRSWRPDYAYHEGPAIQDSTNYAAICGDVLNGIEADRESFPSTKDLYVRLLKLESTKTNTTKGELHCGVSYCSLINLLIYL